MMYECYHCDFKTTDTTAWLEHDCQRWKKEAKF